MAFLRHKLKIFNSVIEAVTVYVVHLLMRKKESAQILRYDKAML